MSLQDSIKYHAEQLRSRCSDRDEAEEMVEEVVEEILEEHPEEDEQDLLVKLQSALDRLY